jgi:hypothetical protein
MSEGIRVVHTLADGSTIRDAGDWRQPLWDRVNALDADALGLGVGVVQRQPAGEHGVGEVGGEVEDDGCLHHAGLGQSRHLGSVAHGSVRN